jgi:hypothetical protein
MKEAIVFFGLGVAQGIILCDWLREKQLNKAQQRLHASVMAGKKGKVKA